jgi:hypothetical protein
MWGVVRSLLVVAVFLFFCIQTARSIWSLSWTGAVVFGVFALGVLVTHRGLFIGFLDVLFVATRNLDIRMEANGLGFLVGDERWWLFLDGLSSIDQLTADLWTLQHWNGTVVHIPVAAITDEQIASVRAAMGSRGSP